MIKPINGRFLLDERPFGPAGPRIRKRFDTKREAKAYLLAVIAGSSKGSGELDTRKLTDLVDQWYELHGHLLKDGPTRYQRTLAVCRRLGNPFAGVFEASDFARYRKVRLRKVSVETVNHETRYLRAVFNELSNLGLWQNENPLKGIRTFPVPERELSFLDDDQIKRLLGECKNSRSEHLLAVVVLCLATGARWGEANRLPRTGLLADRVRFVNTKNGRIRVVPIRPALSEWLLSVAHPSPSRSLFADCRSAFRRAVERAGLDLPKGQLTHVLRHTYASHSIMNGGDVVTLQRVLGHSDLKLTMRYAHLAPDYLAKAVESGPLGGDFGQLLGNDSKKLVAINSLGLGNSGSKGET